MPFGYFTIEQYKRPAGKTRGVWTPVIQLDAGHHLTDAFKSIETRNKPGLYRVLQMQRCIWAETKEGKLKLYPAHASKPESLDKISEIFIREKGHRPTAKARADRKKAKANTAKK